MTNDQEKREIVERLACQCYVDHDDTYVWGTLPEEYKEYYLEQAEYWTKLLRHFEMRDLLSELANSPIAFASPKFLELQVPRATVAEAKKLVGGGGCGSKADWGRE